MRTEGRRAKVVGRRSTGLGGRSGPLARQETCWIFQRAARGRGEEALRRLRGGLRARGAPLLGAGHAREQARGCGCELVGRRCKSREMVGAR